MLTFLISYIRISWHYGLVEKGSNSMLKSVEFYLLTYKNTKTLIITRLGPKFCSTMFHYVSFHSSLVVCLSKYLIFRNVFLTDVLNVYFLVPISEVTITNPAIGDTVNTTADRSSTLQCKTSGGLPAATVSWYIASNNSYPAADFLLEGAYFENKNTTEGVIEVTSTLEFTPKLTDHYKRIFCVANNTETIFETERKPLLIVNCKYELMYCIQIDVYR